MKARYERNLPSISPAQQRELEHKHVLVVGCGGLGGFIIENLARMGVGEITAVDGDVFEESNLNRQILSTTMNLGRSKALEAVERVSQVNPGVKVNAVRAFFDESNAEELVAGIDLVIDALDNIPARLLLEDVCSEAGVTLVHGAIQGWLAQVTVVEPGEDTLHAIYGSGETEVNKTSLSFTPPLCAAIETAEAIKLLTGEKSSLSGKLLTCDLRSCSFSVIPLS